FEFEVNNHVRFGEDNEILVRVWAPVNYYWKHRSYTVKGSYGGVDQKPDDITALGITRPVWLTASESNWMEEVAITTPLAGRNSAEGVAELELAHEPDPESRMHWELTLSPRNFSGTERYQTAAPAEQQRVRLIIPVQDPKLWWTWDHGQPNLYNLDIRLVNA